MRPYLTIFTLTILTTCDFWQVGVAKPNPGWVMAQTPTSAAYGGYIVPIDSAIQSRPRAISVPPPKSPSSKPPANNLLGTVKPRPQDKTRVVPVRPSSPGNQYDLVVTTTDVEVVGGTKELQQIVRQTIKTRLGGDTSASQLEQDRQAILATGFFAYANVSSIPYSLGLKVIFRIEPIVVRSLELTGAKVLTPTIANNLFKSQLGSPVSPAILRQSVEQVKKWYEQNGYVLAQVLSVRPSSNGVLKVEVAEGVVAEVKIGFVDKAGKPAKGRTRADFLTRQLKLKPGGVFRQDIVQTDLQQLVQLGLFDKAEVSLNGDARKLAVTYQLRERPARSVNVGGGYSADIGIYGLVTYRDQNWGGVNQQLGLNLQVSTRDIQFDGRFTSPYLAIDPDKLGYSINAFRRRGLSQTFDEDIKLSNGDQAREGQFGGGISFNRPIDNWQASVGLNYTRTSIRDSNSNIAPVDAQGNRLSFSGRGIDDLVTVSLGMIKDRRDNTIDPTEGSLLSLTTEQSIPIGLGNILMNRLLANYSQYFPVGLLNSNVKQEVVAFNLQGGTTIGDLPPYQAFNLGGANTIRGYENAKVASGRSYILATAEYRFPLFSPVGGVLFADFGTDLGSGETVPGQPGVVRGKPGNGFGYGAGVRVNSPIGIIRADFGLNNRGESRLQFGFGNKF